MFFAESLAQQDFRQTRREREAFGVGGGTQRALPDGGEVLEKTSQEEARSIPTTFLENFLDQASRDANSHGDFHAECTRRPCLTRLQVRGGTREKAKLMRRVFEVICEGR